MRLALPEAFYQGLGGQTRSTRIEYVGDALVEVDNGVLFDFQLEAAQVSTLLIIAWANARAVGEGTVVHVSLTRNVHCLEAENDKGHPSVPLDSMGLEACHRTPSPARLLPRVSKAPFGNAVDPTPASPCVKGGGGQNVA